MVETDVTGDQAWQAQRQWSLAANRAGAFLDRWRAANLLLLVVGSVLGALATQERWFSGSTTAALGVCGAGALALAGIVQTRLLTADRVRAHVVARATSETLKGLVHQYLAAVPPFSGADRADALRGRLAELHERARDHAGLVVGVRSDERPPPPITGISDYVRERAEEQRDWHARRAEQRKGLAARWRGAELVATAVAAVLAAAGGALERDVATWVAVATTASAAFSAHLAAKQHAAVADSYATTSADLTTVLLGFDPASSTQEQAAAFVGKVESVLAAQNKAWVGFFAGT